MPCHQETARGSDTNNKRTLQFEFPHFDYSLLYAPFVVRLCSHYLIILYLLGPDKGR
jgi:hypothetical protein